RRARAPRRGRDAHAVRGGRARASGATAGVRPGAAPEGGMTMQMAKHAPCADTCGMPRPVYYSIRKRLREHAARQDRETFDLVARVNGMPSQRAEQIWRESSSGEAAK